MSMHLATFMYGDAGSWALKLPSEVQREGGTGWRKASYSCVCHGLGAKRLDINAGVPSVPENLCDFVKAALTFEQESHSLHIGRRCDRVRQA